MNVVILKILTMNVVIIYKGEPYYLLLNKCLVGTHRNLNYIV